MQYKISTPIRIRYLELEKISGITDLKIIVQPPSGSELSPIAMTEVDNQGIYEASFTPDAIGWWWVRIKSATHPGNVYSKSYFVGTEFTTYPPQEDGKLKNIDDKVGEVQASPTQYTLLGRIKDLWDKLNSLFTDGLAKIKIWDGTYTALVNSVGRLKVDASPTGYIGKSLSEITDIAIPISTDYWILNLSSKQGIIDEFHIIVDSDKFLFKINVDGTNYFDEKGADLKAQYLLDVATGVKVKNIETVTGKELHWTIPIYFNSSIQIGIRNNLEDNKKLKGYIILYREEL